MVIMGNLRKFLAGPLLVLTLIAMDFPGLALLEAAANQVVTQSKGATEIKVSPSEVILDSQSITDNETLSIGDEIDTGEGLLIFNWEAIYSGIGVEGNSYPTAMTVKQGCVYVTGRTWNADVTPPNWDYLTIKYDIVHPANNWEKHYDGGVNGFDEARAITVDDDGNVYVTGYATRNGTGADMVTIKYNQDGGQDWAKSYRGEPVNGVYPPTDDYGTAIVMDDNGYIYVTGASEGFGTGWDYIIIKYNANGARQWSEVARYNLNEVGDPMKGNRHDIPSAVALKGGNIYVTGSSWRSRTIDGKVYPYYDYATVKFDTGDGHQVWANHYAGVENGHDYASALAVDNSGNIYVTGSSQKEGNGFDYLTVAYQPDGTFLWTPNHARRYGGLTAENHAYAKAIAVDSQNNNIYITGLSFVEGKSANYTTVKYLSGGTFANARGFNSPGNDWDEPAGIAIWQGNVYVTGISRRINSFDYTTIKCLSVNNPNFSPADYGCC